MIRKVQVTATCDGVDGSATATAYTSAISGKVLAVHLDYSASQAAGCDVTISTRSTPSVTIHTETDSATDVWRYPRVQVHDTAETVLTYDGSEPISEPIPVDDEIKVAVAQGNDDETVNYQRKNVREPRMDTCCNC